MSKAEKTPGRWYSKCDESGEIISTTYSDSFMTMIESEKTENWRDFIHPEDLPFVTQKIRLFLSEKFQNLDFDMEYRIWVKNKYRLFHEYLHMERNEQGTPVRIEGIVFDREDQNKTLEQIEKSNNILSSLTDIYYTMYVLDLENGFFERILKSGNIKEVDMNLLSLQDFINFIVESIAHESHVSRVLDFVNLSTLSFRLKNRNIVSFEFIEKVYGWMRISFIVVDREKLKLKKVLLTAQIVDDEKKEQMELMYFANHDELTGLLNRRAYEKEVTILSRSKSFSNLVYISMDINGLKKINDSLGHAAGDELINGASACVKERFSPFGKIFRMGGDEFVAILEIEKTQLLLELDTLSQNLKDWKGKYSSSITISIGYVCWEEHDCLSIQEMGILADKRMYENKQRFYKK